MIPLRFVIWNGNTQEASYWNNDSGWGCLSTAIDFSIDELDKVTLPMGGQWLSRGAALRLPEIDY